jgi:bifunctional non-homologous end joining protein LigD
VFLKFIEPCAPIVAKTVPAGEDWQHEVKFDGFRLQVAKQGRLVCLYGRRGHEWGKRLAALAEAMRGIPAHSAVLDAELCFPEPNGAHFFQLLKTAFGSQGNELVVYAFDLLHLNGQDLTSSPLIERRQLLDRLLSRAKVPCLHLVDAYTDGQKLFEAVEHHKLEGIVSKRKTAPYRSGESSDWVKVKTAAWRETNRARWRLFDRGWM